MKTYELPFGKFVEISDNLIEIIVYEGIELSVEMLEQVFGEVFSKKSGEIGLLVNKLYEYTYTFEAQRFLGSFEKVKATAFVTYTRFSNQTTKLAASMPRDVHFNNQIFDNREEAIEWLKKEMAN